MVILQLDEQVRKKTCFNCETFEVMSSFCCFITAPFDTIRVRRGRRRGEGVSNTAEGGCQCTR